MNAYRLNLPADFIERAKGLENAVRRNTEGQPTKRQPGTVERYERLRPIIEPLVQAGATQWDICGAVMALKIVTPGGKGHWTPKTVQRALKVLGLRTKGQIQLGVS